MFFTSILSIGILYFIFSFKCMLFHLPFLYTFYLTQHIKYFSDFFKQLFFSLLSLYLPAWSHCKQCYKGAYRLTSWVFFGRRINEFIMYRYLREAWTRPALALNDTEFMICSQLYIYALLMGSPSSVYYEHTIFP